MNTSPLIMLASASPRRRELLEQLGVRFTVAPANIDESIHEGEKPKEYVLRMAREKALAGFEQGLGLSQAPATLLWMRILDVGIPIVTSIIAIFIIKTFDITEEKAHNVRAQLEARRGKA